MSRTDSHRPTGPSPHQRHFRGVLAMAQLDHVALHWCEAEWKLTREQMLEELTESWYAIWATDGSGRARRPRANCGAGRLVQT